MTDLATLEAVKLKLSIDPADTSRDSLLTGIINGVNAYVARRTRFALANADVADEIHENVRQGDVIYTSLRPLDPDTPVILEGRVLGSADYTRLVADVVDPYLGKVRVVGAESTVRPWPPSSGWPLSLQSRWRRWRWPILRVGYSVLEATGLDDLAEAANNLAAYSDISSGGVGGEVAETVGQVQVQWSATAAAATGAIPTVLDAVIEGFVWPKGRLAG